MFDLERRIVYFEKAGRVNTERTLRLAMERAQELGINNIVVASTHGYTAEKALEILSGTNLRLVVVGISRESFSKDVLRTLEEIEVPLLFSDEVEYTHPRLMKNAFRKLSEGVKVCMDICMVAAEGGVVPEGDEVVAVAGTGQSGFEPGGGADTALVMIPRKSKEFNTLLGKEKRRDLKEMICKPR